MVAREGYTDRHRESPNQPAPSAMKTAIQPANPFALLLLLLSATALATCADKANPVLPSTGGPVGVLSGTTTSPVIDAGSANDAADTATADTAPDSRPGPCDLVTQTGCESQGSQYACYPSSGIGTCMLAGGVGVMGSCGFGEVSPLCSGGLTCITTPDMAGTCLHMCDVNNPVPTCGLSVVCHPLPGFTSVGYCQMI